MTGVLGTYGSDTYGSGTYGGFPITADPRWVIIAQTADGWVDIGCDARTVQINAARSSFVEAFSARTATVEFTNDDGRYSTWTSNSVWLSAGGWVTGIPVRIGVVWQGTLEWRFTGTTDRVEEGWPLFVDAVAVATMTATDGFKQLARYKGAARAAVGAGELSGARVNRIAVDAAWSGPTRVDAGTVTLAATTLEGLALDQLRVTGESEWGWLYIDGDGALVFRQRNAADTDPRMTTVQTTFTDTHALAGACYADATQTAADDEHIINQATVTPPALGPQTFSDAPSIAHFGVRTWDRDDLPLTSGPDALGIAQAVVTSYRADDRRIDAVVFDAAGRPDAWPAAHKTRITDRIRFVRTLPGGHQLDAELQVLERSDRMVPLGVDGRLAEWQVTLSTASAAVIAGLGEWDVGTWDDSIWGV